VRATSLVFALALALAGCKAREPAGARVSRSAASGAAYSVQPAPALPDARSEYSMTSLGSGKVLVAGGKVDGAVVTSSAWLYDPDTGRWDPTGALSTARASHAAVLLPDGRVLAAGGIGPGPGQDLSLASAEIYDPVTGTWSATGSLGVSRYTFSATELGSGMVLVAGGVHPNATGGGSFSADATASCEIFEPETGSWRATGALPSARSAHTATLLADRRVLVAGGAVKDSLSGNFVPIATAVRFDETTEAWTPVGPLASARQLHTAVALHDGRVLVAGGSGAGSLPLSSAELFQPDPINAWTTTGSLAAGRFGHAAVRLPTGAVVVAGGGYPAIATVESYDPVLGTWSQAGTLGAARQNLRAVVLPDMRILVGPGWQGAAAWSSGVDLVDSVTPSWSAGPALHGARASGAAWALVTIPPLDQYGSGKVLVAGGRDEGGTPRADLELLDPDPAALSGTEAVTIRMPFPRADFTATALPSGKVLVVGGDSGAGVVGSVDLFDPGDGTSTGSAWEPAALPALSTPRAGHTATLLGDGTVLVVGGRDAGGAPVAAAERFDPGTGAWSPARAPSSPRRGHTATLLRDGRVLVAGGVGAGADEIYDPAANAWSVSTVQAGAGRAFHTATPLLDGRVLLAGGLDGASQPLATAAIWDPQGGSSAAGGLAGARARHGAVLLPTGHVLVAGGDGGSGALATAEVFDPVQRTWQPAPGMLPRSSFALSLLPDGGALAVGGALDLATDRFAAGTHPLADRAPYMSGWMVATVTGMDLDASAEANVSGDGTDGTPGSSAADHPSFVLLRADGQGGARALPAAPTDWFSESFLAPPVSSGPVWIFPVAGGALGDGVPTMANPPAGRPCSQGYECGSGFCVDGFCCNEACGGGASACQTCAKALGAPRDGTCGAALAGTICRAAGGCDLGATCDGANRVCPANPAPAGTICRPAAGLCDVEEKCDGTSNACPADVVLATGTVCRAAAGPCDLAETCDGTSPACPADFFASAETVCRPAASDCDVAERCTGTSASCPPDAWLPENSACSAGHCEQQGQVLACVPGPPPPPPDTNQPARSGCGGCGLGGDGVAGLLLVLLASRRTRRAS
jgi:hypothetical protein